MRLFCTTKPWPLKLRPAISILWEREMSELPLPAADARPLPLPAADARPLPLPAAGARPLPLPAADVRPLPLPAADVRPLPVAAAGAQLPRHGAANLPLRPLPAAANLPRAGSSKTATPVHAKACSPGVCSRWWQGGALYITPHFAKCAAVSRQAPLCRPPLRALRVCKTGVMQSAPPIGGQRTAAPALAA